MATNATFQEFIQYLPVAIDEARRSVLLANFDAVEHWQIWFDNAVPVLNILSNRMKDMQLPAELNTAMLTLRDEAMYMNRTIENALLFGMNVTQSDAHATTTFGRPRMEVSPESIAREFSIFRSWKIVAHRLGVSEKTLRRRRIEFGMELSSQRGQRNTYTAISFDDLCATVRAVLGTLPDAGESLVIGSLRARGIFVQRHRVRDAINEVDPVSRAMRRTFAIVRRVYNVPSPNSLW